MEIKLYCLLWCCWLHRFDFLKCCSLCKIIILLLMSFKIRKDTNSFSVTLLFVLHAEWAPMPDDDHQQSLLYLLEKNRNIPHLRNSCLFWQIFLTVLERYYFYIFIFQEMEMLPVATGNLNDLGHCKQKSLQQQLLDGICTWI